MEVGIMKKTEYLTLNPAVDPETVHEIEAGELVAYCRYEGMGVMMRKNDSPDYEYWVFDSYGYKSLDPRCSKAVDSYRFLNGEYEGAHRFADRKIFNRGDTLLLIDGEVVGSRDQVGASNGYYKDTCFGTKFHVVA